MRFFEALFYTPESRGFDSQWCHCNFSLIKSFQPHCGPEVDLPPNRNEYHENFLEVKQKLHRADNRTTVICQLSQNLGASTSWNPLGLQPD